MTATQHGADSETEVRRCGCCGRPRQRLAELGTTPGTFICGGCALWAARRTTRLGLMSLRLGDLARLSNLVRPGRRSSGKVVRMAIPVLPSNDLERSATFYEALGFAVEERFEGYLVMNSGPVELHFSSPIGGASPVTCFIHVDDAVKLWKKLREADVAGVGPPDEKPYGLVEFDVTDPDGNRIRIGSPASH